MKSGQSRLLKQWVRRSSTTGAIDAAVTAALRPVAVCADWMLSTRKASPTVWSRWAWVSEDVLDAGLRAERQSARDRTGLEEDVPVDQEAGQAPSRHATAVATEDFEEHGCAVVRPVAPCRIVSGAVVASP